MNIFFYRYGRRPIMGASFFLMFIAGLICAVAPQDLIGQGTSYPSFAIGRFLLACATRGIAITGFVMGMLFISKLTFSKSKKLPFVFLGSELGKRSVLHVLLSYLLHRWSEAASFQWYCYQILFCLWPIITIGDRTDISNLANVECRSRCCSRTFYILLFVSVAPLSFLCQFEFPSRLNFSILPESPRWLISKQRYKDAERLFHHIAERNKRVFDQRKYQEFVTADKKVIKQLEYR